MSSGSVYVTMLLVVVVMRRIAIIQPNMTLLLPHIDAYSIPSVSLCNPWMKRYTSSTTSKPTVLQYRYGSNIRSYSRFMATPQSLLIDDLELVATDESTTTTTASAVSSSSTNNNSISTTTSTRNRSNDDVIMIRNELLELLSTMRGEDYELRQLEDCINTLEGLYIPCQTVSFLNLMMNGTWQFLFSSHWIQRSNHRMMTLSSSFRLREMKQHLQTATEITPSTTITTGNVTNTCIWEWNQQSNNESKDGVFDCYGTFSINSQYVIQPTGRIIQCPETGTGSSRSGSNSSTNVTVQEQQEEQQQPEMILQLLPKSSVPQNVTLLMQSIQRSWSQELFDISQTGYDITYMDDTIRIIRYYTPTKYNGIRNIFRRSSL